MPELFLAADKAFREGRCSDALVIQNKIDEIIYAMCECRGNLYAVIEGNPERQRRGYRKCKSSSRTRVQGGYGEDQEMFGHDQ